MSGPDPRVLLTHRSPHHAGPSGHAHLADHLDGARSVDGVRSLVPYRIRKALTPLPGTGDLYDSNSLAKELGGLAAIVRHPRRRGVVHVLDGERDVGWLPALAMPTRWRSVATFHTPPARLLGLADQRRLARLDAAIALGSNQVEILADAVDGPVHRLPYGVDTDYFRPSPVGGPERSTAEVLFVGHHLRDIETLVAAAELLARAVDGFSLTAVVLPSVAGRLPTRPWLTVRTGVSDEELREAYRRSIALLLPMTDAVACTTLLEA
ncbi:MAG: hypothetical protein AAGK32_05215, partial [Actinomycetota bacterium]